VAVVSRRWTAPLGEIRARGVRVLGTGVNPGFVLDALVLALSGAVQSVTSVHGLRVVDVSARRPQLQRKVVVGLTREEFDRRLATGRAGHVGARESASLIAAGLEWDLDRLKETLSPVISEGTKHATVSSNERRFQPWERGDHLGIIMRTDTLSQRER